MIGIDHEHSMLALKVVRGYLGDRSSKPVWGGSSAFNILGKDYQRPFELATLRLNHMVNILPRCEFSSRKLCTFMYARMIGFHCQADLQRLQVCHMQ